MEFRKCPACQASVLEDDVADCPFCGASMSGKPAATPAPASSPPPAAMPAKRPTAKQSSGKPAVKSSTRKPQTGKTDMAVRPGPDDDDDPFDVDTSVVAQAPRMAPRPAKGRMIRIVCPMCETPGFISPKMQGRDVKCVNADCLVPVFKAPRPEKKAEPEEEASGFSTKWLALGSAVLLPLAGLLVWYFVLSERGPKLWVPPDKQTLRAEDSSEEQDTSDDADAREDKPPPKRISLAEIQQQALSQSVNAARERDDNRSKPYCRRMAAAAYAQAGNLQEARHQIKRLQGVTSEPFYRVEPLVEIAWQQLKAGDRSAAEKTIDAAFDSARSFPGVGRPAAAAVISVAAVLATVGRIDDAQEVIRRLDRDDDTSLARERVAALKQITFDLEMFDLDRMLRYSSLNMAAEPLAVAVTIAIGAHGAWDRAIAWSLAADNIASREDCLSALAVVAARDAVLTGDDGPVAAVVKAGKQLSATGQSRVADGLATGYLMQDDREAATSALGQALSLFETVPRPEALPLPSVRAIHDTADPRKGGLSSTEQLRSAAVGAAQMARLQVLLGDTETAWTTFLKAWDFTRGMGPEWEATSKLVNEIADQQPRAQQRLRRELGFKNRDLEKRAFNKYRRHGRTWGAAADQRFELEVILLREAVIWGYLENVAEVIRNPQAVIPSADGQRYRSSSLPGTLAEAFATVGNEAKSREMLALATRRRTTADPIAPLIAQTERLFQQKQYIKSAQVLGQFSGRHYVEQLRDLRAMQLSCRMLKLNQPDQYFPFILALKDSDSVLTEDCFEITAALAVREGMAADLWERYSLENLSPTQRVAFFRGLIAGIVATQAAPTSPDSQTAELPERRAAE